MDILILKIVKNPDIKKNLNDLWTEEYKRESIHEKVR